MQGLSSSTDRIRVDVFDEVALCAEAAGMEVDRVRELAGFARDRGESLIETLVRRAGVEEGRLLKALADLLEIAFIPGEIGQIPPEVLAKISPTLALGHQVIPVEEVDGTLRVACCDPFDWRTWDDLCHVLGRQLEKVLCPRPVLEKALKAGYGLGADTVDRLLSARPDENAQLVGLATTDLSDEEAANEPTVVNLVNQVLSEAIRASATDIHFEPHESKYRIRYRIDGMLEDVSMPATLNMLRLAVVSRIKIMSGLNIAEKRLPQDGRARVSMAGQEFDLRVSVLPGIHGEAVVIRVQNRQMVSLDLASLGFEDDDQERIRGLTNRSYGLILVTGPTGSGKTTTLYTCLHMIRSPRTKTVTIEDPVEYWMDDILQMQVSEAIGFTFARALRSILRHDPDIMLVGEIRDRETADIAIRSALTGHLVFSTLHTNDAASAITRLCDIGLEPFLVASSLHGVLAQRLVRRLCPHCKAVQADQTVDEFGQQVLRGAGLWGRIELWDSQGCERCRFTGYRGRLAAGEVLVVSSAIRGLIQQRVPADSIREQACKEGMRTLRDSALKAVAAGQTSLAEVLRVTQEDN